ncbi:MAG: hypothetical protein AAFR28_18855 [Pseudomonadota bacterium]
MRRPTPIADQYAWYHAALKNPRAPVHEGEPQCGLFKARDGRASPWAAVQICLSQPLDEHGALIAPERHYALINGDRPIWDAARVDEIWLWAARRPITAEEYAALLQQSREGFALDTGSSVLRAEA